MSTLTVRPDRGTPRRPRWLLPAVAAALVAAGLVVAGVVSLSTVLVVGFFGGMLWMHVGGHGGHGGPGTARQAGCGGHAGHRHEPSAAEKQAGAQHHDPSSHSRSPESDDPFDPSTGGALVRATEEHEQHRNHAGD